MVSPLLPRLEVVRFVSPGSMLVQARGVSRTSRVAGVAAGLD